MTACQIWARKCPVCDNVRVELLVYLKEETPEDRSRQLPTVSEAYSQ